MKEKLLDSIQVKEVSYGSELQKRAVELRDIILRKPLGLVFTKEYLESEREDHHFIAILNNEVVGALILRRKDTNTFKLRQVAIREELQKKGIGKSLMEYAELFSIKKRVYNIEMHARKVAVPFYEKLNYIIEGELFFEVGIPHYKMVKTLKK